MSHRIMVTALCLLSVFNLTVLIINMSSQSKGEPSKGVATKAGPPKGAAGTAKYQQFIRDPDFNRAVRDIVQECTVNVDLAKVEC
jgi:hypothetical protein